MRAKLGQGEESKSFDDSFNKEILEVRITSLKNLIQRFLDEINILENPQHSNEGYGITLHDEVRRFEMNLISCALELASYNQAYTARLLGVRTSTLNSKIKRYGILIDVRSKQRG
jgi:transcriptional regulator with GAF, ATPase, and Fis domain